MYKEMREGNSFELLIFDCYTSHRFGNSQGNFTSLSLQRLFMSLAEQLMEVSKGHTKRIIIQLPSMAELPVTCSRQYMPRYEQAPSRCCDLNQIPRSNGLL